MHNILCLKAFISNMIKVNNIQVKSVLLRVSKILRKKIIRSKFLIKINSSSCQNGSSIKYERL